MKILVSRASFTRNLIAFLALLALLSPGMAQATHFRYGQITWKPTGNPGEVIFTVKNAFRRGYTGIASDGKLAVGDIFYETIGATRLFFGDGAVTSLLAYKVDAVNTIEDWVIARAINPATGLASYLCRSRPIYRQDR